MAAAAAVVNSAPMQDVEEEEEVKGLDAPDETSTVRVYPMNTPEGGGDALPDGIDLTHRQLRLSVLLATALSQDSNATAVPVDVKPEILQLIGTYLKHHAGEAGEKPEIPLRSKKMADVCKDPWDAQFIENVAATGKQQLYDLTNAANLMHIDCLMYLCCAKVATFIKGVPIDKIRENLTC